jgi:hypothetical protein
MADRALAIVGGFVFNALFVAGIVLIPGAFAASIFIPHPMCKLMIGAICAFFSQSMMAFGRQSYFYDSYATWGFIISVITLSLLILTALCHYLYLSSTEGSVWSVLAFFLVQLCELVHMFAIM